MSHLIKNSQINEIPLLKYQAEQKINKVLDVIENGKSDKMIKCAFSNANSVDINTLVTLFANMLSTLNLKISSGENGVKEVVAKLTASNVKNGEISSDSKSSEIKIASKRIKDSHYQIDVSKDAIKHNGKQVFMVSCYARDAYLGRYLIKRNYFYTMEREASAEEAYDEIVKKFNALKNRYYEEVMDVSGIFAQAKTILDGVISEIEFKDDSVGTTVSR